MPAFVENDGGEVQHLAGAPGDPKEAFVALDLEELVGSVVVTTQPHGRGVADVHGAEDGRVLVCKDGGARLEVVVTAAHGGLDRHDVLVEHP